jgi:MFS family permease
MAVVLFLSGFAGGLVVSPNQTLTLADVPVRRGGVAGSVGQLGQRIGASVGTAVALSLFYATIYNERGSDAPRMVVFHDAYVIGLISVGIFLGLALVAGVADMTARRRDERSTDPVI